MKTADFAKLLRRVAKSRPEDRTTQLLGEVANHVDWYPESFRKGLQRVSLEPEITAGEVRDALVTIKLFLIQPTLCGHIDQALNNRAKIAMNRLWNAMLPDYATAVGEQMLDEGYEPRISDEKPRGITS